jgi:pimeloyl-ACP methyl ester carboxylesterase
MSLILAIVALGQVHPVLPDPAGWYQFSDRSHKLLTYAAEGGYRLIDFDLRTFEKMEVKEGKVEWTRGDQTFQLTPQQDFLFHGQRLIATRVPGPYTLKEVKFKSKGAEIVGTLMLPNRREKVPGVVMIHGSSESHRNNLWYQHQAHVLTLNGIAVLLPDKRGCGSSKGDWKTVGLEAYADDANGGFKALAKERGVDSKKIGVMGLSQGGWVAPLAANRNANIAFVISASSAAVRPVEQINHEMHNTFVGAGFTGPALDQANELQRLAGEYILKEDWQAYDEARKKALDSPIGPMAKGFPDSKEHWMWAWWRRVAPHDPLVQIEKLNRPYLAVFGEEDEKDNVPVKESVRRLQSLPSSVQKNLTIRVLPGSGHALEDRETGWISEDYLRFLVEWIHRWTKTSD